MTKTFLYSVFAAGLVLTSTAATAQVTPPPAPAPGQAPAEPVAPVIAIIGEEFRVELQVAAWISVPSTVLYSDTETVNSTVVTGSNLDFKGLLGLKNQTFPQGHVTIRLAPK